MKIWFAYIERRWSSNYQVFCSPLGAQTTPGLWVHTVTGKWVYWIFNFLADEFRFEVLGSRPLARGKNDHFFDIR